MRQRVVYQIRGIVQGVGFRPFVYKIAIKNSLLGFVLNSSQSVEVEVEGECFNIESFENDLFDKLPPLAKINSLSKEKKELKNYSSFEIIQSKNSSFKTTLISPDICVCDDCLKELNDKKSRRYQYPFINCTNCGPRYTIIDSLPYDRENTSMKFFKMCKECEKEYLNPLDRRYHAQPISCFNCGPTLSLYKKERKLKIKDSEVIAKVGEILKEGDIVALKGLGGFHLVCDARKDEVVKKLRDRKNRVSKPLAVMFKNIEEIKKVAILSQKEEELITSKEKPIVIVKKRDSFNLSSLISPKIDRVGVFLPYTPLHYLLFNYIDFPIVATSANLSNEPIMRSSEELRENLLNVYDYLVDFNREIINACDDSVVMEVEEEIEFIRLSRGYAPKALPIEQKLKQNILALGANQKNTISFAFENQVIISPHIGDLNSIKAISYFKRTIETFKRLYNFKEDIIVCDRHPEYESSKYAKELKSKNQNLSLFEVNHHFSHILATLIEYRLKKEVLGFSFDGSGYGDDKAIWGGEVLLCTQKEYKRKYHFKYFKLLGGERSIKEPKRVALSIAFESFTLEELLELKLPFIKEFSLNEIKILHKMWQKSLNSPLSSSIGRLFDAIASFSNLLHISEYEGQSGMILESFYQQEKREFYDFEIVDDEIIINFLEIIKEKESQKIPTKFINTLVEIIVYIAKKKSLEVVLSGGVFQNKTLLTLVIKRFKREKIPFFISKESPLNDGGVSLGEIYTLIPPH